MKEVLKETLKNLDNVEQVLIMTDGTAIWSGNMFFILGWVTHIQNLMKKKLMAITEPEPSNILRPKFGPHMQ